MRVNVLLNVVFVLSPLLLGQLPAEAQVEGFRYERKETREATKEATLAYYRPRLELSPWSVVGPFDNTGQNKHDVVYPPERLIDMQGEYEGKDGRTVRWSEIDDDGWMMIDLKRFGDEADNTDAIAYLYREIVSEGEAQVDFEMGSDDGVKLWFNGRLVVDADVYRGMNIQDHLLELSLKPGRNTLLVKVTQGVGGWQFQMRPRLDPRIAALLGYYLERDFPLTAESAHYRLLTVLEPDGVALEVGGLDVLPDGRPILTTRRGEVWIVEDAYDDPPLACEFKRFAFGLHEPLGAVWRDGRLYVAQRGELTALMDSDGDDRADVFETGRQVTLVGVERHDEILL